MGSFSREIEVRGHLIDSSILTRIFDGVMDLKGDFEVLEITIGKRKGDPSYARLMVQGGTQVHLDRILDIAYRAGATSKVERDAHLARAPKNMAMPDNFYSTTNNRTQIFLGNRWTDVQDMMMDKCIVVKGKRAACVPIREVKRGDLVVVGESGVKVTPPERPREGVNVFEFMGSSSSSERPTQHIARRVAEDMYRTKAKGGRIVLVAAPP
ncbi:conserved hypothetical protein [Cenarchaeum symbiosum A]|uniref:Uncharacterized protein n=1 Tax=Cenarchaeum symbiosum (strain A) TaxID=414004 RepID=A0RU61_CENSY|nr:conserved hypothetical protein [Cenarchaeum symbiosum A]